MEVKYGNIKCNIDGWKIPSKEVFEKWKNEFIELDDAKFFKIYLVGSFVNIYKEENYYLKT